ncbi:protein of unknown function [Cardinium endosymbiont cEper1 of Encarsia pergandiella]|nr:protein of unknown function [Cardinium endosymbiont cEper1 of Encarsia pergandiella]
MAGSALDFFGKTLATAIGYTTFLKNLSPYRPFLNRLHCKAYP